MNILITGTRKGIGRFLAEHFLNNGHQVYGCSRSDSDLIHDSYQHFNVDVSSEASIKTMINTLKKQKVSIDLLINNAGIASMNHFLLTPTETAARIINTNFLGTFTMCRETVRLMRKSKRARIINFSTVAVPLNLDGEAAYAASKAAIVSLTKVLAKELSPLNITVNAIGPTPVKTDLVKSVPENKMNDLLSKQAIERFGEFSDVLNVIEFFAKEESDFITGQVIYLGGVF